MRKYLLPIFALLVFANVADCCWYNGASVGVTSLKIDDMTKMSFHMKDEGFCLNFCNGYESVALPIRFEQQLSVSRHYFDSDIMFGVDKYKKDCPMYSYSIIENVFLDIGFEKFTPYIGVGVGYHYSRGKFFDYLYGANPHAVTVKIKKLIFQGTLGIKSTIGDYSQIFLEYQHRCCKKNTIKEHGFHLGLRRFL